MPPPGMMPTRAWVSAKLARSDATRNVHCSATSSPPVTAGPLIAPMTGLPMTGKKRNRPLPARSGPSPGARGAAVGGVCPDTSFRSTPAQNAEPAPVRMTASTPGSESAAVNASHSAWVSARLSALRAAGRLSVTHPIRSRT
jgi:hypothetical protein